MANPVPVGLCWSGVRRDLPEGETEYYVSMQEMEQGYKREVKRVLEGRGQDVAKGGVEGASQRLGAGWVYRAIHSTEREESTALK